MTVIDLPIADDAPETTLVCVPPWDVDKLWHAVAPLIDDAYAAVDQPTPDVRSWLGTGEDRLLWVAVDREANIVAALTTSIEGRRSGRALRMVAASGRKLDHCRLHLEAIEAYAKAKGCCKMEFDGRQGWGRALPGYVPKLVSFEKRL